MTKTPRTDELSKHERHDNVQESRFWCAQYKNLARTLEAENERLASLVREARRELRHFSPQMDAWLREADEALGEP